MTARYLLLVFDSVYLIALAAWLGSMLFLSFGVVPVIFQALSTDSVEKFVRALLPRYYLWGAIAGAVALPSFVAGPLCYPEYRGAAVGVQSLILVGGILLMLYGGNSLTPAINRARDAGAASNEQFLRLHRRAVWLNALAMAGGVLLFIAFAARPAPRTEGIVELSPIDRTQKEIEAYNAMKSRSAQPGVPRPAVRDPSAGKNSLAPADESPP